MKGKRFSFLFLFVLFLLNVSCDTPGPADAMGIISVLAVDNDPQETPIPDVEIAITPGSIVKKTNANGSASFEVAQGDYYLDADVCCLGPGYIHYHEPVAVVENETTEVKLLGCLRCE
jgi:hypothetical protein